MARKIYCGATSALAGKLWKFRATSWRKMNGYKYPQFYSNPCFWFADKGRLNGTASDTARKFILT